MDSTTGSGLGPSIVRTLVPAIVSVLLSLAVKAHTEVDTTAMTELVTVIVLAVYYTVVRFLETHVNGSFGWLLGLAKQPVYTDPADTLGDDRGL